jgi:AcrR family transcriptional regulator
MPKLWSETIETHRDDVRRALLDATAALVAQRGLRAVTMSEIATTVGIGRATLYKYFPNVESIMVAWHERQIAGHLQLLVEARDRTTGALERLRAVLETFAALSRPHRPAELSDVLHSRDHVTRAEQHLHDFVADLIGDGVAEGLVRTDLTTRELASYCVHAVGAAGDMSSDAAVRRLVGAVLAGLRPSSRGPNRSGSGSAGGLRRAVQQPDVGGATARH